MTGFLRKFVVHQITSHARNHVANTPCSCCPSQEATNYQLSKSNTASLPMILFFNVFFCPLLFLSVIMSAHIMNIHTVTKTINQHSSSRRHQNHFLAGKMVSSSVSASILALGQKKCHKSLSPFQQAVPASCTVDTHRQIAP